jgi:hypothetical protein
VRTTPESFHSELWKPVEREQDSQDNLIQDHSAVDWDFGSKPDFGQLRLYNEVFMALSISNLVPIIGFRETQ